MATAERNFADFGLGDNPMLLADRLLQEVAVAVGVRLGHGRDPRRYQDLVAVLGPQKALRQNRELTEVWTPAAAGHIVRESHIQDRLDGRSLWTPDITVSEAAAVVATGAVPNWMLRAAREIIRRGGTGAVWLPSGNRTMDTPNEQKAPEVQAFFKRTNKYPTEAEFQEQYVLPLLQEAGMEATVVSYDTGSGSEIARRFVQDHPEVFAEGRQVLFVRAANAGVQLASQFRSAVRAVDAHYDGDPKNPQVFVATDTLPVAATTEQNNDPANFQNGYTGLRQLGQTALVLAQQRLN